MVNDKLNGGDEAHVSSNKSHMVKIMPKCPFLLFVWWWIERGQEFGPDVHKNEKEWM